MKCPFCTSVDNGVVDSRETEDGHAIRRRRSCTACSRRFTTYERVEEQALVVVKKDGSRAPFDRQKLLGGVRRACEKRPVPTARIQQLIADIERRAQELGEREIASRWIGEQVMAALRELDEVAYVRFASVYRSFRDVEEFARELEALRGGRVEPARADGPPEA
ncbi:MAG: transcriptional repressor NrdR [Deltaproteobacteria bacterium]|nr:transcriptional repressor NrdR [Deltaproteobacteria bacterium]